MSEPSVGTPAHTHTHTHTLGALTYPVYRLSALRGVLLKVLLRFNGYRFGLSFIGLIQWPREPKAYQHVGVWQQESGNGPRLVNGAAVRRTPDTRPNPSYPLPLESVAGTTRSVWLPSPSTSPQENPVWVAKGWCERVSDRSSCVYCAPFPFALRIVEDVAANIFVFRTIERHLGPVVGGCRYVGS